MSTTHISCQSRNSHSWFSTPSTASPRAQPHHLLLCTGNALTLLPLHCHPGKAAISILLDGQSCVPLILHSTLHPEYTFQPYTRCLYTILTKDRSPAIILLLLFNSLWMKFKLLTKALWDLVPASVKSPLSTCSHCCLHRISPQYWELWGTAIILASGPLNVPRYSVLFPSHSKTYPCPVSACSDPFHLLGFPQCSYPHHLISQSGHHLFLLKDALHIVIICCLLLYKLYLFTRLTHLGEETILCPTWSTWAVPRLIVVKWMFI